MEKTPSQIYTEHTAQLLNTILSSEFEGNECDCIELPRNESFITANEKDMPGYDMKRAITHKLGLADPKEVDSLVGHWEVLLLTEDMLKHNLRLFPDGSFTDDLVLYGRQKADSIWSVKCPEFLRSFSKPLFNKDFTVAIMDFGYMGGCLYAGPSSYKKIDGVWQID